MRNLLIVALAVLTGCATPFGVTKSGEKAHLYTLESPDGLKLEVTDFGGRLVRCWAPDRAGKLADVTLGWNTVGEYEQYGFSMGTLIGRFGNRIANGRFVLDGKTYEMPLNEKTATRHSNLHSGPNGWDTKVWKARPFHEGAADCLELTLVSPDGDAGLPGTVTMRVTYKVLPDNVWRVEYEATTDKPTVINPTHHSYWNLAGEASGDVLGQLLRVNADSYLRTDAALIPTAAVSVQGTGLDFRSLRPIGAKASLMKADAAFAAMDNWYDHCFVLNGRTGEMKLAAEMIDPKSGRTLTISTTEPGMQMYGAQNMTTALPAKAEGQHLCPFAGVALETQHYPDSPNQPAFPTTVLRPGETFKSVTEYRFGVQK